MADDPGGSDLAEQVTVVATRVVAADQQDAFEDWLGRLREALRAQPGWLDGPVVLEQATGLVHLLTRFDSRRAFDDWEASDAFRDLKEGVERFSIGRREVASGVRPSFALPSDATAPKWKHALLTWVTVFPLLLALSYLSQATIASWPRPLSLALTSMIMTALLTWLILPFITRRTRTWAMQAEDGRVRRAGD